MQTESRKMETRTEDNYGLTIRPDSDCYNTPILVDETTGKRAAFVPKLVPGKAWTVVLKIGSKKSGRQEYDVGVEPVYTMHQAQVVADTMTRDTFRRLRG